MQFSSEIIGGFINEEFPDAAGGGSVSLFLCTFGCLWAGPRVSGEFDAPTRKHVLIVWGI